MSEADVRLVFAEEEARLAAEGAPTLHDVTPSAFIMAGLEVEAQQ